MLRNSSITVLKFRSLIEATKPCTFAKKRSYRTNNYIKFYNTNEAESRTVIH
jgi:predicted PolB exonuclease-like 3'-5' exonuclease